MCVVPKNRRAGGAVRVDERNNRGEDQTGSCRSGNTAESATGGSNGCTAAGRDEVETGPGDRLQAGQGRRELRAERPGGGTQMRPVACELPLAGENSGTRVGGQAGSSEKLLRRVVSYISDAHARDAE